MTENKWENHPRLKVIDGKKLPSAKKVTPEMVERRRKRSNKPFIPPECIFNSIACKDAILHFVHGIGDDNPLFTDAKYAANSKYKSIIAPGTFLYSVQWIGPGSGMPGVHAWYSGGDWEWWRPVVAGDEYYSVCVLRDLVIKEGRMTSGNIYIDYTDVIYVNQRGEIVGKELTHTVWAEREASETSGKYRLTPKPEYTRQDWINILEMYDKEERRGNNPRYWEDVKEDDKVGPMIKGPLTVRDELGWLMGAGSPYFKAHKIELEWETRHPDALEFVEERGEADVPELVHVFDEYAHAIGIERAYDYGHQRMSWLGNLYTNWMGDDAFLWKMSGDLRVFNQMGDLTTFEGKVVRKYIEDGKYCVDIEAGAKNQRNEWSMPPLVSTVILPSRKDGQVKYPEPPAHIVADVKNARPLEEVRKES